MGLPWKDLGDMDFVPAPAAAAAPRTIYKSDDGILICYGTTVPTDADTGYAPGCIFIDADSTGTAWVYINEGTLASCDFNYIAAGT